MKALVAGKGLRQEFNNLLCITCLYAGICVPAHPKPAAHPGACPGVAGAVECRAVLQGRSLQAPLLPGAPGCATCLSSPPAVPITFLHDVARYAALVSLQSSISRIAYPVHSDSRCMGMRRQARANMCSVERSLKGADLLDVYMLRL